MRWKPAGQLVLRAFCDLCVQERRRNRGEIGTVTRLGGDLRWFARKGGNGRIEGGVIRTSTPPGGTPAGRVLAHCRHHGWRSVATADVLAAVDDSRPTIVLTSSAVS